jgi:protein disulfide-isomerase-like protein
VKDKARGSAAVKNALADAFAPKASLFTFLLTGKEKVVKSQPIPKSQGAVTVVVGKTFDKLVTKRTGDVFIEFYAPWCGHCKELEPKWDELGALFKGTPVTIAKIDATTNDFPKDWVVNGFPTLFYAPVGGDPVPYDGERELSAFIPFVGKHRTDKSFKLPAVPVVHSDVTVLTDENFASETAAGAWLVKFYAPWCGHCKSLAPTWEKLAAAQLQKKSGAFKIAKIDCTSAGKDTCTKLNVGGYPTLKAIVDGKTIEYDGAERTLEAFNSFISKHQPRGRDEL